MQNRIDRHAKVLQEEQDAAAALKRQLDEGEAWKKEKEKQAIINNAEHQELLAFAQQEEIASGLKEIWQHVTMQPLEIWVHGWLGYKKKPVAQLPFEVVIESITELPKYARPGEQLGAVRVGFQYLVSSISNGVSEVGLRLYLRKNGDSIEIYYVTDESRSETYSDYKIHIFSCMEDLLEDYAKAVVEKGWIGVGYHT